MLIAIFLSIMAGAFGVFQAGLNKEIAGSLGYTSSMLFNGVFFSRLQSTLFLSGFCKTSVVSSGF